MEKVAPRASFAVSRREVEVRHVRLWVKRCLSWVLGSVSLAEGGSVCIGLFGSGFHKESRWERDFIGLCW